MAVERHKNNIYYMKYVDGWQMCNPTECRFRLLAQQNNIINVDDDDHPLFW